MAMKTTPVPTQSQGDTGALPSDAGALPIDAGTALPPDASALPPIPEGAPASPTDVGMGVEQPGQPGMVTDSAFDPAAAQADLQSGLDQLKQKEAQGASSKAISDNQLNEMKKKIIMELFDLMKKAGVDPTDQKSISDFLNSLQQQSPDLYELFDFAFNNLTGQPPTAATTPDMMSGAPMSPPGTGTPPAGPQDMGNIAAAMGPGAGAPPAETPPAGPPSMPNLTAAMGQ